MSSEFNDMERMFQEGLQNYEVTPPAHIWGNIQKQKRRGILFYRWRIASALLLLCIAGASAYYFNKNNKGVNNNAVSQSENNKIDDGILTPEKYNNVENLKNTANSDLIKNNSISNSGNTSKNTFGNTKKTTITTVEEIKKDDQIANNLTEVESSVFDTKDLFVPMFSKENIRFRYLIYPSLMQYVFTTKKLGKKYYIKPTQDDDKEKMNCKYSIEIVGGPSYAFRKLSGNGDLLRNESEKASLSLQTGLKINYHINPKWSIQSGLTWEKRNEKIKYNLTEVQDRLTTTSHQVTVFHPVLPPRTITVVDSAYTKENVNYKFSTTNQYTTINIPLIIGYYFGLGKMQYRISAGPLFNIYSNNASSNLVRNGDKIEMVQYKESAKIKTSFYTAVAFLYPLNQNYDLFTEASYYTNLNNRLNKEAALRQKNFGFNVSGGLKINLIK